MLPAIKTRQLIKHSSHSGMNRLKMLPFWFYSKAVSNQLL